jgi:pimeloyl-ACP methyl ester carboxylesterase
VTTPWVQEDRIDLDGRSWAVRQAGDPSGRALVYFHGTPSCRLEPAFADADCADLGVRLVSFDRPGYGAGPWLADHLPDATLRLREDDGHLGVMEHTREILETLRGD